MLRMRRFNTGMQLVALYKAQLLSYIEYRTAAIYHACQSSLDTLDGIQDKLLEAAGMSPVDAINNCRLAPLSSRRDMALLGLIHRAVLGSRRPLELSFELIYRPDGAVGEGTAYS